MLATAGGCWRSVKKSLFGAVGWSFPRFQDDPLTYLAAASAHLAGSYHPNLVVLKQAVTLRNILRRQWGAAGPNLGTLGGSPAPASLVAGPEC